MVRGIIGSVILCFLAACGAGREPETVQVVTVVQPPPQVVQVQPPQPIEVPQAPPDLGVGTADTNQCIAGPADADTTGGFDITQVSIGRSTSCALLSDGTVRCWGQILEGGVGNGQTGGGAQLAPGEVVDISDAQQICTGWELGCARLGDGTVRCWGRNGYNQVKRARGSCFGSPQKVPRIARAVDLACGGHHACARRADGSVWCWGRGMPSYGEPGRVRLPGKAVTLAAGIHSSCAILSNNDVYCWRDEAPPRPEKVEGFPGPVEAIALGERFGCGLLHNGQVACWGEGFRGELGVGELTESATPRVIPGLFKVAQLSADHNRVCARTQAGELLCWGDIPRRMRSRGGPEKLLSPTRFEHLAPIVGFDLGQEHICAQPGSRLLCCWGNNYHGQLGNNSKSAEELPSLVTW